MLIWCSVCVCVFGIHLILTLFFMDAYVGLHVLCCVYVLVYDDRGAAQLINC